MKKLLILSLLLMPTMALAQSVTPTEYTLKVKAPDLDKIGKGLQKLPFEEVAGLLQDLQRQIVLQQTESNKPVENKKEPDKP